MVRKSFIRQVLEQIARKKSNNGCGDLELNRCLGRTDLFLMCLSSMAGAGVYVIPGELAKSVAGPAVGLSFLLAGFASLMCGLCFAELSGRFPKAGSMYLYSYLSVGELGAFASGWIQVGETWTASASIAKALSGYIDYLSSNAATKFFRAHLPVSGGVYFDPACLMVCLIMTLLMVVDLKHAVKVNNVVSVGNLLILGAAVVASLCYGSDLRTWQLSAEEISGNVNNNSRAILAPNSDPADQPGVTAAGGGGGGGGGGGFLPFGIRGMLEGAATCMGSYAGFCDVTACGDEALDPSRAIPFAMMTSCLFATACLVTLSLTFTLMQPFHLMSPQSFMAEAFVASKVTWAATLVNVGAMVGIIFSMFSAAYTLSRVLYAMAADGLLFRKLAAVNRRTNTPVNAGLMSGAFVTLMACFLDTRVVFNLSALFNMLLCIVAAALVLFLRYQDDDAPKPEEDPPRQVAVDVCKASALTLATASGVGCAALAGLVAFCTDGTHPVYIVGMALTCMTTAAAATKLTFLPFNMASAALDSFKMPMVPLVPLLVIFLNVFLSLQMSWHYLVVPLIWVASGLAIYFGCLLKGFWTGTPDEDQGPGQADSSGVCHQQPPAGKPTTNPSGGDEP